MHCEKIGGYCLGFRGFFDISGAALVCCGVRFVLSSKLGVLVPFNPFHAAKVCPDDLHPHRLLPLVGRVLS